MNTVLVRALQQVPISRKREQDQLQNKLLATAEYVEGGVSGRQIATGVTEPLFRRVVDWTEAVSGLAKTIVYRVFRACSINTTILVESLQTDSLSLGNIHEVIRIMNVKFREETLFGDNVYLFLPILQKRSDGLNVVNYRISDNVQDRVQAYLGRESAAYMNPTVTFVEEEGRKFLKWIHPEEFSAVLMDMFSRVRAKQLGRIRTTIYHLFKEMEYATNLSISARFLDIQGYTEERLRFPLNCLNKSLQRVTGLSNLCFFAYRYNEKQGSWNNYVNVVNAYCFTPEMRAVVVDYIYQLRMIKNARGEKWDA